MEKLSEIKRIGCVFAKPKRAMADIAQAPRVWLPILCIIGFPLLPILLNMEYYANQMMAAMVQMMQQTGMSMDVSSLIQIQMISLVALTPIQSLLAWLLFSTVVFVLTMILERDGELRYKVALSIGGYAFLVKALLYFVSAILLLINPDYLIQFSLYDVVSRFAAPQSLILVSLLQQLSLFRVWEYALVGVGLCAATGMARWKAAVIMVLTYGLQFAVVCVQLLLASPYL